MGTEAPGNEQLSTAVVQRVAQREGVEPHSLPQPLYEAIDPDALDSLFRESSGSVVFQYLGYEVTVYSSGVVELDAAA